MFVSKSRKGASLVELLFATAVIAAIGLGAAQFFSNSVRVQKLSKHSAAAMSMAQKQVQLVTSHPFALIHKTDFSDLRSWEGCTCTAYKQNYDTHWYPPQTQVIDGVSYTVQTCVGQVENITSNGRLVNQCPDYIPDTGLRRIHVTTLWTEDGDSKNMQMDYMVSRDLPNQAPASWTGFIDATICQADKDDSSICDPTLDPTHQLVNGAEVTVTKLGVHVDGFYGTKVTAADQGHVHFTIPQDDPYDMRVWLHGYFPGRYAPVTVMAGTTNQFAIPLRLIPEYESNAGAEIFVSSQPVVAQIACGTPEAVELFNPTVNPVTINTNEIKLSGTLLPTAIPSITIPAQSSYLIANAVNVTGTQTDLQYSGSLLSCTAGSVVVLSPGNSIDRVAWGGAGGGNGASAPGFTKYLSRAGRRGHNLTPLSNFAMTSDTHNNMEDFIPNNSSSFHNSKMANPFTTGVPPIQTLQADTTIQYGDPTSSLAYIKQQPAGNNNHHLTALMNINAILGPDGIAWKGVSEGPIIYQVTAVSGHSVTQFMDMPAGRTAWNDITTRVWTLVPSSMTYPAPPIPWCTTGANCDADSQTVIFHGRPFISSQVDYSLGGDTLLPDRNSPYISIDDTTNYVLATGIVKDMGGNVLEGIPVGVFPNGSSIPTVTKLTDSTGRYKILVAGAQYFDIVANANQYNNKLYRPWYKSGPKPPTVAACHVVIGTSDYGTTEPDCDPQLDFNTFFTPPTQDGTGCVQGTITSQETGVPLSNITMHATDTHGQEFNAVLTDVNGNYQLSSLPAGTDLIITPQVDRNQGVYTTPTSVTMHIDGSCPQTPTGGPANFGLSGVPAHIQVTNVPDGSLLVAQNVAMACGSPNPIDQSTTPPQLFSAIAGPDQTATLDVPLVSAGAKYYICCWTPKKSSGGYNTGVMTGVPVASSSLNPEAVQTGVVTCH